MIVNVDELSAQHLALLDLKDEDERAALPQVQEFLKQLADAELAGDMGAAQFGDGPEERGCQIMVPGVHRLLSHQAGRRQFRRKRRWFVGFGELVHPLLPLGVGELVLRGVSSHGFPPVLTVRFEIC